jgi:DNA-binding transcriptional MerR regulator
VQHQKLAIGSLSQQSGCNIQTIRHYEDIGLLPSPKRTNGNHRLYDTGHIDRLIFIRRGRELGFSISDIRELFELSENPDASCEKASAIAKRHLEKIKKDKASLSALEKELSVIINACPNDKNSTCSIIEALCTETTKERS